MSELSHVAAEMQAKGVVFFRAHAEDPDMFQVLGERGSGTNLIRKVISLNADIFRTEGLGWKHGFPVMAAIPRKMLVVCAFRSAADWAISMYKRPWHAHPDMQALSFSEFLRAEWRSIVDRPADFEMIHPEIDAQDRPLQFDRHPLTGRPFENLFALRRAKMAAVLGMLNRDCHVALIQLEALTRNPEALMAAFRSAYGLSPKREGFRMPKRRMGNNFNLTVKDREAAPSNLSAEDHAFMLSQLDLETEATLGYRYEVTP